MSKILIPTNEYNTPITEELLNEYPDYVREQFMDFIDTVPLLRWMISEDRPRAKDLPRDDKGRIIVDISHPHILEDMDYFRPAALFYKENGCFSFLKPNQNKNSEYGKWFYEEVRRCREGYVRESDGEWVTGYLYWYLNYSPIMLNKQAEDSNVYYRVEDFPNFWEGIYYRFHYLEQARRFGKHSMELSRRGSGKSFSLASIMSHNLILGENQIAKERVTTVLTAYTKEYLTEKDGTFSKFTPMIGFTAAHTEFPRMKLKASPSEMIWKMGYKTETGDDAGSQNAVMGLSVKDDEGKVRGKRGWILFEEMGSFPTFKDTWDNVRDSVKEGDRVFSLLYAVGTAGDDESDFSGVRTMLYNPDAYEVYALENVYDRSGKGTSKFAYFFPTYISRAGCMDKDGNSDVVKALLEILKERWVVKQGGDSASLLKRIANMPITPEEAILKVQSNFFPVVMLNERLRQLDTSPRTFDDVYVGTLIHTGTQVMFKKTDDVPIRKWTNNPPKEDGVMEIFVMPQGNPQSNRYIIGVDPVDNDQARSESLFSFFVFDLFTDEIVAEYTGRKQLAEDGYELVRLAALFWNAMVMYESNRKMMYSYFSKKRSTYLLADCPEYLKSRGLIKYSLFGSSIKGITMNGPLIGFALDLLKDWLMETTPIDVQDENGEVHTEHIPKLYKIRNRALLQEMISYGPHINTDRVSAMFQVMLYREHFKILFGGAEQQNENIKDDADDDFFNKDWDNLQRRLSMHH